MKSYVRKIFVLASAMGVLLLLILATVAPARAQVSGSTLTGTITDAQGGAVVGAKISATDAFPQDFDDRIVHRRRIFF